MSTPSMDELVDRARTLARRGPRVARQRALGTDQRNADLIQDTAPRADLIVQP